MIERLVELGVHYLLQAPTPVRSGRFGVSIIKLSTPEGDILLRRSLVGSLRDALSLAAHRR